MKILRRIIIISALRFAILWTIINYYSWKHCCFTPIGTFTKSEEDAIENKCIIAIYKTEKPIDQKIIRVERMHMTIYWRYIFYSDMFYSKYFWVNQETMPAKTNYILANNDTVEDKGISGMDQLPNKLMVYLKNDTNAIPYYLIRKYQENIDNIASISFIHKIGSGPFLNDDDY